MDESMLLTAETKADDQTNAHVRSVSDVRAWVEPNLLLVWQLFPNRHPNRLAEIEGTC